MKGFATLVVGLIVLSMIAPILPWIIGIGGVIFAAYIVFSSLQESDLSVEDKTQRNQQRQEVRHAERMARIEQTKMEKELEMEAEQQKRLRHAAAKSTAAGMAGKLAVNVLMHSLTGGTHRHHH